MTTAKALGQIQRVMRFHSPSRNPDISSQAMAGINRYSVVSNLERLEAGSGTHVIEPQRSNSPLRYSNNASYIQEPQILDNSMEGLGASVYSTRLQVNNNQTNGDGRVSRSPASLRRKDRSRSRSKSPGGHNPGNFTLMPQNVRGVTGPNIDTHQYTTLNQHGSQSPLRNSIANQSIRPMTEFKNSPLRQRNTIPSDEEISGNQAATIMTSSMIKQSLAQLRTKLDTMKRDKEAVEIGI